MSATTPIAEPVNRSQAAVVRSVPSWGVGLSNSDYSCLEACWISRNIADAAMLRRVEHQEARDVIGQKGKRDCSGILIPYYVPGEPHPHSYRIRLDNPEHELDKNGTPKQKNKYLSAPGSANRLYFPPGVTLEQLAAQTIPIVIVEGEKKALALQRLANYEANDPRFIPIAIAGVWNWRGVTGKASGPNGNRIDIKGPINDLNLVVWNERTVTILFDGNVSTNPSVGFARTALSRELKKRGSAVRYVELPADCDVNGVDDLLAKSGPEKVLALFNESAPATTLQIVRPSQFESKPEGLFRITGQGEKQSRHQLTNYSASIRSSVVLDDGVESRREFEIVAELIGRESRFTIPASEFIGMEWPIKLLGPGAITYPNQRDYARTAIQSLSLAAEERVTFTHTGWRKLNGRWLFIHGAGAVGAEGAVCGVNVRLPGTLSRYELMLPESEADAVTTVRASLRSVCLGPGAVSFPLRAATYRATFGDTDFALHLVGETGAFKSELAALEQQHFGPGMDRLNLPGSWSSTGNALEQLAFYAKDALIVIDDFAPQGNIAEVSRYHAAADRIFRAAGNHSGRIRLDSKANLRESKPPRGLVLSTGEDVPRGHSLRARLLVLEVSKGQIDSLRLKGCQDEAHDGSYAKAMGAYAKWVARDFEALKRALAARVSELRGTCPAGGHARTPEIISNLQAGFEMFLQFSVEIGAIDDAVGQDLSQRCWEALCAVSAAQAKHQAATEPTERYLSLLRACLVSGQAHLMHLEGHDPDRNLMSCGWRAGGTGILAPQGRCIGWFDDENIFLEPTVAFQVVQRACGETSESLPVTEQTLRKRLNERGILASIDKGRETLTIRKTVAGLSKSVLHLRRSTLLPVGSDDPEISDGGE